MPSTVLDRGVQLLGAIATYRTPALDVFFSLVTDLGSTIGYLILLPLLWWGVSWKLAARLFVAVVLSVYVNTLLKETFAVDRPFVYADVAALRTPADYSFPSGHAQHAFVFWSLLALHVRRRWFALLASAVVLLIGFSRLYLGVHYPSDVLAGWAAGGLLVAAYVPWSPRILARAAALTLPAQLGLALGIPLLLNFVHGSRETAVALGGLSGALAGLACAHHQGLYRDRAPSRRRRAWLTLGLVGLPALYLGMRAVAPPETTAWGQIYLGLRYAAIGLWVSWLVPRIVDRVKRRFAPQGPGVNRA